MALGSNARRIAVKRKAAQAAEEAVKRQTILQETDSSEDDETDIEEVQSSDEDYKVSIKDINFKTENQGEADDQHGLPLLPVKVEIISPPSPEFILCDAGVQNEQQQYSGYSDPNEPSSSHKITSILPTRSRRTSSAEAAAASSKAEEVEIKWSASPNFVPCKVKTPEAVGLNLPKSSTVPDNDPKPFFSIHNVAAARSTIAQNGKKLLPTISASSTTSQEVISSPKQIFQNTSLQTINQAITIKNLAAEANPRPLRVSGFGGQSQYNISKLVKTFHCSRCSKWFANERHFWKHLCAPGAFLCEICGLNLPDEDSLMAHLELKTCGICKDCGKEFTDYQAMKAHRLLSHPEGATFKCSVCKISFDRLFSLTTHIRKVHSKKKFDCDICKKVLPDAQALKAHQNENTCAKCKTCGEVFSDLSSFRKHKLVAHEDEPAHQCHFCDRSFPKLNNLTYHIRKAHAQKTYDCQCCGERTLDPQSLKEHEEANLCGKCAECGKRYHNFAALRAHTLVAHPVGASHKCRLCLRNFKTESGLRSHLVAHNKY